MKHILVCTDGSRLSQKVDKAAVLLARDPGANLTAHHVSEFEAFTEEKCT